MVKCLIGYSGFVGSSLLRQTGFAALYRAANIGEIAGLACDTVVCAAAPGQKWLANRDPEADLRSIELLISNLETIKCTDFILISTVDVFKDSSGAHEDTKVDETGLHPYGLHRRMLEKYVAGRFPKHLIVRLPGLIGPGLRKNVIYDFLHNNNLDAIDSRGIFQFYPMVNLWYDIQLAQQSGLKLVHLTAEPVCVADIAATCFGRDFRHILPNPHAVYDFQSNHAQLFGGYGRYQYNRRETLQAVRAYVQSEPLVPLDSGKCAD